MSSLRPAIALVLAATVLAGATACTHDAKPATGSSASASASPSATEAKPGPPAATQGGAAAILDSYNTRNAAASAASDQFDFSQWETADTGYVLEGDIFGTKRDQARHTLSPDIYPIEAGNPWTFSGNPVLYAPSGTNWILVAADDNDGERTLLHFTRESADANWRVAGLADVPAGSPAAAEPGVASTASKEDVAVAVKGAEAILDTFSTSPTRPEVTFVGDLEESKRRFEDTRWMLGADTWTLTSRFAGEPSEAVRVVKTVDGKALAFLTMLFDAEFHSDGPKLRHDDDYAAVLNEHEPTDKLSYRYAGFVTFTVDAAGTPTMLGSGGTALG